MKCLKCNFDNKLPGKCQVCSGHKKKVKTKKGLIKELDTVFSLYIRQRYAKDGIVFCFTSGKPMKWKDSHAGHFISRRHYATRWDELNVQVQSVSENLYNQGNSPVFAKKLAEKYGQEVVDNLLIKKNNFWSPSEFELELLIKLYKQKLEHLNK